MLTRGGSRIPRRRGCQPTNSPDFPKKLHEIKKILVHGGGVRRTPLGSATANVKKFTASTDIVISQSARSFFYIFQLTDL